MTMKKTSPLLSAGLLTLAAALTFPFAGCAGSPTQDSTGQYVDDSAITTKVKAALLNDEAVKSFEIHVTTFKGVVQLSGFVDNSDQKTPPRTTPPRFRACRASPTTSPSNQRERAPRPPLLPAMLYYSVIFLIIALVAAGLGFFGLAGAAAEIAKVPIPGLYRDLRPLAALRPALAAALRRSEPVRNRNPVPVLWPVACASDLLFELQLRVARRADELARRQSAGTSLNLHCWLLAEAEILGLAAPQRGWRAHAPEPAALAASGRAAP